MTAADLIGLIGYMGLTGAFILCALSILLTIFLHIRKSQVVEDLSVTLVHIQTGLLTVAFLSSAVLLQLSAFEYEQVFNAVENGMGWFERIGGLWSGQASSLLFWSLVMSVFTSLSIPIAKSLPNKGYTRTILLVLQVTLLFFIAPDVFVSNPFAKIWLLPDSEITTAFFPPEGASLLVAVDGQGMNPQLRHIAMMLHPPTLYFGLVGFFLPYAFALAALINRDDSHAWIHRLFPIALASWIFLTVGMVLGSWWAYTILGWGGYWGWDAVEISGLLPWLLSFGLLHSMRLALRKKPFRRWVYGLSFAIVIFIMLGILITRSGILESVHAYASGTMGPVLTTLVLGHLSVVVLFIILRRRLLSKPQSAKISFQDRLFRWFNLCLVGLVAIYLFGQTLPLTSQLVYGETIAFRPENYEQISAPLLALLCVLTALCPMANLYDKDRAAFWRRILVLSVWAMVFPIAALFFTTFSLAVVIGFLVAGFLLLSWLVALVSDVILPAAKSKNVRGKLGMIILHLGLAAMAVGIMGVETMTSPFDRFIALDETSELAGYSFTLTKRDSTIAQDGDVIFVEEMRLVKPAGRSVSITPSIEHLSKFGSLHAVPAIRAGFFQDVQVVLKDIPPSQVGAADFRITFFPLMSWIWAGGALMTLGGSISLFLNRPPKK